MRHIPDMYGMEAMAHDVCTVLIMTAMYNIDNRLTDTVTNDHVWRALVDKRYRLFIVQSRSGYYRYCMTL